MVVVNDTRSKQKVEITIKDKDSGRTLLSKMVEVDANGKLGVDELPKVGKNELWIIEYKVDGQLIAPFELEFRRDDSILRYLTVRLDKHAEAWADLRRQRIKSKQSN